MTRMKLAVVGAGISGLVTAWLLRRRYDVTLFEQDSRLGGHSNTVNCHDGVSVDTGFMVFNEPNYPLLTALFQHLGVESYPTRMSFAASINNAAIEYSGSGLNGLFAQRRNLLRPGHWRMLGQIMRFNTEAAAQLDSGIANNQSMGDFLKAGGYHDDFIQHYLLPMAAAIWSCPTATMLQFPCRSFIQFFRNHGLIQLRDRPQWRTVEGGSRRYVERLQAELGDVRESSAVTAVSARSDGSVELTTADGIQGRFDKVVLACHADQTLALLQHPRQLQSEILGAFRYQTNRVYLHRDSALMPRQRRVWSSWNYLAQRQQQHSEVSVTYWMNSLQRLDTHNNWFVSLNPLQRPDAALVEREFVYEHPVFDQQAIAAQQRLQQIQGLDNLWFAGAWSGYGFHEDGIRSAVEVGLALGVEPPWHAHAVSASRALLQSGWRAAAVPA